MKLIITHFVAVWIIFLVLFVSGCTAQNNTLDDQSSISELSQSTRITEIALPGMFCQACARNAKIAFQGINGVIEATVDIETKKGMVIYESAAISKEYIIQNPVIQAYDGKILSDREYR